MKIGEKKTVEWNISSGQPPKVNEVLYNAVNEWFIVTQVVGKKDIYGDWIIANVTVERIVKPKAVGKVDDYNQI